MAGKNGKRNVRVIAVNADDVSDKIDFDDDGEVEQPAQELDFESALSQFDDDDECKVFAHETVDGRIDGAYLFSEPVKGFKLDAMMDRVRSEYGSGNYRAVLKRNSKVIRGQSFSIKLSRSQQAAFDLPVVKQSANSQQQSDNGMSVVMAMMQQQSTRQHELMLAMMGAKSSAQPADSTSAIIDAVSKIHGMTKRDDAPASKIDPLEMFLKGVTFAKEAGSSGEESVLQTAIKELAPMLTEVVKNQPQRAVPQSVPHGTIRETESLPAPQEAQPSEFDALIKMLCRAANQDADPVVYAELVMDQLTDEKAIQLCQSDVGYGIFVAKLPPDLYAAKKEWFDSLRAIVIASVSSTDSDDAGASSQQEDQS